MDFSNMEQSFPLGASYDFLNMFPEDAAVATVSLNDSFDFSRFYVEDQGGTEPSPRPAPHEDAAALWRLCSPWAVAQERAAELAAAQEEAQKHVTEEGMACSAVIVDDPFGEPLKQRSPFSLSCQLVCNPDVQLRVVGDARVEVVAPHLKNTANVLRGNTAPVENGFVKFTRVAMTSGSRLKEVRFRVSCKVEVMGNPQPILVVSNLTRPTMVLTNEKQWATGAVRLFRAKLFSQSASVPWLTVARELQRCWIVATRQPLEAAPRPLRYEDLVLIKQMFVGESTQVTEAVFSQLFEWFTIVASRLRYGTGMSASWANGGIIGFVSKGESDRLLTGQPDGTALLRFSQSAPTRFSLVYVKQGSVHHYLLPQQTCSTVSNLGPFLATSAGITQLLTDAQPSECLVERHILRVAIEQIFQPVKNDAGETPLPGYDEALQ